MHWYNGLTVFTLTGVFWIFLPNDNSTNGDGSSFAFGYCQMQIVIVAHNTKHVRVDSIHYRRTPSTVRDVSACRLWAMQCPTLDVPYLSDCDSNSTNEPSHASRRAYSLPMETTERCLQLRELLYMNFYMNLIDDTCTLNSIEIETEKQFKMFENICVFENNLNRPNSSSDPVVSSSNSSIRNFCPSAWSTTASKYSLKIGFKSSSIVRVLKNCEPTQNRQTYIYFNMIDAYLEHWHRDHFFLFSKIQSKCHDFLNFLLQWSVDE